MIAIVLSKKNLPAKTWLLVFLFSLLASALVVLSMEFYVTGEDFNFDAKINLYDIMGMTRGILNIVGWAALLLFIISFRSVSIETTQIVQPIKDNKTPHIETLDTNASTVSTTQYLYFFGFAIVIGGCIVTPITLPYILGLFSPEGAEIYLGYSAGRQLFFCLLLVGLASFAYADELRFSFFRYIGGMIVFGGAIATQAVKEYYSGKGVILPVGLLGIAYATIFGHIGLWVCNAITGKEERNKQVALILALIVFPLIAIITFMFVQDESHDRPVAAVKSQSSTSTEMPEKSNIIILPEISEPALSEPDLMLEGGAKE